MRMLLPRNRFERPSADPARPHQDHLAAYGRFAHGFTRAIAPLPKESANAPRPPRRSAPARA
jgi:hypothetical protein